MPVTEESGRDCTIFSQDMAVCRKAERTGQRFGDLALPELISTFSCSMHRAVITTGLENMVAIWSQTDEVLSPHLLHYEATSGLMLPTLDPAAKVPGF